jgi:chemotaxis protein histidine kinase CheA
VIEIKDDGRGLQRDKILAKAIERKLVSADAHRELSGIDL